TLPKVRHDGAGAVDGPEEVRLDDSPMILQRALRDRGEVGRDDGCAPTEAAASLGRLLERVLATRGQDDRVAACRELQRELSADATRGAGHYDYSLHRAPFARMPGNPPRPRGVLASADGGQAHAMRLCCITWAVGGHARRPSRGRRWRRPPR